MKIFLELRKLFKFLGIEQNQRFNRVNLTALLLFVYGLGAMIAFLLFEPKTFVDLGNAFFGAVSFFLNIFTLSSFIFKEKKVFDLFDNFEELIEKRNMSILIGQQFYYVMLCNSQFISLHFHSFQ